MPGGHYFIDLQPSCYCNTPLCNHIPDGADVIGSADGAKGSYNLIVLCFLFVLIGMMQWVVTLEKGGVAE